MNLFDIFLKGGVLMWAILLSSVIGLSVVIDRFITLRRAKINVPAFIIRLRGFIKNKDMNGALSFCMQEKSPMANMVRKGRKKCNLGHERVIVQFQLRHQYLIANVHCLVLNLQHHLQQFPYHPQTF